MFCPRCGQQQASDAARFCSRCGFRLEAVAGLLVTNGAGPDVTLMEAVPAPPSPKRKGAQLGGKLMLSGLFLGPALAALGQAVARYDDLGLVGVFVFLAGLFRLIYAL
ncbi:MAG TPA: zinc ribbon domain-containing protein, partial [Pyrinomonadaceae bacterium]|nr:zinc ribbon domain-containing protein [Pyrinomonadaceae bacterium]